MSVFDFEEEIERARADAISEGDRAAVRTAISRQRLPEAVREAGWRFLYRGTEFDPAVEPAALVIGIAPWNPNELQALNELLNRSGERAIGIWIFDIDDCENFEDVARFLPGRNAPIQTPVVAEYGDGILLRSAEGAAALDFLARLDD